MKKIISKKWLRCLLLVLICLMAGLGTPKMTAEAAGNYYIRINKGTNVVTVYNSNGTPYRAFVCSTGAATPTGTYYTSQKLRWHELDGPVWGQYCTRITGHILFHSVWYYQNGNPATQSYAQYNRLGTTASHGCVRLTVGDSKWIYDNCPVGTRVEIFYGSSANDPLGKPGFLRMNGYMGWDPTDPDPRNPYAYQFPSINVSGKATTISCGSAFDYKAGIVAKDSAGNDITASMTYSGQVDTGKLGTYTVTYYITDALGRSTSASVTYTVVDTQKATISGIQKQVTKEYNSTFNIFNNNKVKAYTADNKNLTKKIKVQVKAPGSKSAKTYKKKTLKLTKTGTYRIYYTVTNPNNNKLTKETASVKVVDTKKPKLSGVKSEKKADYKSTMNLKKGVTAKLVSGKSMTSKITIKIKVPGSKKYKTLKDKGNNTVNYKKYCFKKVGTYTVQYTVKNPTSKKATVKTTKIKVADTAEPKLSGVKTARTANYNGVMDLSKGVKATLAVTKKDITKKLVIEIKAPGKSYRKLKSTGSESVNYKKYRFKSTGKYTVRYTVQNPNRKTNKKYAKTVKSMVITVTDVSKPTLAGVVNRTMEYDSTASLLEGISAKMASGPNITSSIIVKIKEPNSSNYVTLSKNGTEAANNSSIRYKFKKLGVYTVLYRIENPNRKTVYLEKTATVTVSDTAEPTITGVVASKTIEEGESLDLTAGVSASIPSNAALPVSITVDGQTAANAKNYVFPKAGTYQVTYTATNTTVNPVKSKEVTMTVIVKPAEIVTPENPDPDNPTSEIQNSLTP